MVPGCPVPELASLVADRRAGCRWATAFAGSGRGELAGLPRLCCANTSPSGVEWKRSLQVCTRHTPSRVYEETPVQNYAVHSHTEKSLEGGAGEGTGLAGAGREADVCKASPGTRIYFYVKYLTGFYFFNQRDLTEEFSTQNKQAWSLVSMQLKTKWKSKQHSKQEISGYKGKSSSLPEPE